MCICDTRHAMSRRLPEMGAAAKYQSANKNRKPCIPDMPRLSHFSSFLRFIIVFATRCHAAAAGQKLHRAFRACFSSCVDVYVVVINFKLHAFWPPGGILHSNYEFPGNQKKNRECQLPPCIYLSRKKGKTLWQNQAETFHRFSGFHKLHEFMIYNICF